ncbi:hypothetical protein B0I35DRAFT_27463 [Stachybotrys elegans]|uniref:Mid2 domain-containing protein n=1 Tax=Stachybotrys elegans TaxID=80388 RepID=A0A8K0T7Y0_9HYPO|nr:hypothetical protein B0I35DRAFT_27463 [Stachybotrys elegans]
MVTLPTALQALLVMVLSSTTVSAIPAARLFSRQDNTCASNNLSSCPRELPDDFCCPSGNECIPLAGNTSALCCPEGSDCNQIQPIICDIELQNVENNLSAPIKTTVFDVELERCGGGNRCCPFGYSCDGNRCIRNEDQSEAPEGPSRPTSTSAGPSATATGTGTQSPPTATTSSDPISVVPSDEEGSSGINTGAVIGGVVGGCITLFLIAGIAFYCVRRQKRQDSHRNEKGSARSSNSRNKDRTSFSNIISDPILQSDSFRTDFIRKEPSERSFNDVPQIVLNRSSIPNPFDSPDMSAQSPVSFGSHNDEDNMRTGHVAGARLKPIRTMKGSDRKSRHVDPRFISREPSSESINIFADPGSVVRPTDPRRLTRGTTFTDLMDQADLGDVHRGRRPYVPGSTPRI